MPLLEVEEPLIAPSSNMDVESSTEKNDNNKKSGDAEAKGNNSPAIPKGTAAPTVDWHNLGPPGRTGTIMSFVVILVGVIVSIIMYVYAPSSISLNSWEDGCPSDGDFERSCKANSAVLRISMALTVLFALQLIGTFFYTRFYDLFWIIKFCIFIALTIGFFFASSESFGLGGYAWFARITGFLFLILQQVILLDVAYSWNEKWLEYAGGPDGERNRDWLIGIIVISFFFLAGSYAAIGVMFWQYGHCEDSTIIIGLTLALTVTLTLIQLFFSEEGSILTSAIMTAYATYVCYSAVTLNPAVECNHALDTGYQTLSTAIGLALTAISLLWTTYNTVSRFPTVLDSNNQAVDLSQVTITNKPSGARSPSAGNAHEVASEPSLMNQLLLQVSVLFILVSGYYAMVLTNWATEQANSSISNPRSGRAAMWIQAAGQWIAIAMYGWSLIAPRILSDRDF
jgi:hypothetical protein